MQTECPKHCAWQENCQNQRLTRQQWAHVVIAEAGRRGLGVRATTAIEAGSLVLEYVGEVISAETTEKRQRKYLQAGQRHMYIMAVGDGSFIDATEKGNSGRFINHSCNPNCTVQRWEVGPKIRLGIFADRYIRAGEELCFDYSTGRQGIGNEICLCGDARTAEAP
jgi:[histone H3]-lysine36 N-trimethyltransferase